jgi:hypothetical protein
MYARDRFPGYKKTIFQSRAMLGRYCNGAPQKSPNWGTEFGAENFADCGRLEGVVGEFLKSCGDRRLIQQRSCRWLVPGVIPVNLSPTRDEAASDESKKNRNVTFGAAILHSGLTIINVERHADHNLDNQTHRHRSTALRTNRFGSRVSLEHRPLCRNAMFSACNAAWPRRPVRRQRIIIINIRSSTAEGA